MRSTPSARSEAAPATTPASTTPLSTRYVPRPSVFSIPSIHHPWLTPLVPPQLLSKIDGVNSLNNILLIGMTNRRDMIDDALLRPGRLEIHVEIGLPNMEGRVQILKIHTQTMRQNKRLAPVRVSHVGVLGYVHLLS